MQRIRSTILIADDDPIARERLELLLGEEYTIALAENGVMALAMARELRPDLIILDVMMPGLDGFETCRHLRADPNLAEVPIVMLTALDERAARLRGIESGADDFIAKPFDRIELLARIKTITRLNRYRRLLSERARFEALVERSPDGIVLVDQDFRITTVNPAFYRLLALDPEHTTLLGVSFTELIAPSHASRGLKLLQQAIANPDRTLRAELLLALSTSDEVPAEVLVGSFPDEAAPQLQLIVRDIRERKRAELVVEAERRRVAYDLHDSLAQLAVGAYNHLQAFAANYKTSHLRRRQELDQVLAIAAQTVRETRRLIAGLRPGSLDDFGLVVALRLQCDELRNQGLDIHFIETNNCETNCHDTLASEIETTLYWIVQEALNNIRKHAGASQIKITLNTTPGLLTLAIQDNGRGFALEEIAHARPDGSQIGLLSMRERAAWVGGRFDIMSIKEQGTTITVTVPLDATLV
ncbi:MAG: response regulator [Oscillochloridaceae bacterium umkhey_bin13]